MSQQSYPIGTHSCDGWIIKFVPFSSTVESSFWVRYCREKLETIKLDESPISICALYMPSAAITADGLPRLQCQENSLLQNHQDHVSSETINATRNNAIRNDRVLVYGSLIGYNTLEAFQKVDKNILLREFFVSRFLLNGRNDSDVVKSLLSVLLITFADLKNHKVLYWFGMPALAPSSGSIHATEQNLLKVCWDTTQYQKFTEAIHILQQSDQTGLIPFFIYNSRLDKCFVLSKYSYGMLLKNDETEAMITDDDIFFCFLDPVGPVSASTFEHAPMGWPFRNLIAYLSFHLDLGGKDVQIVSYRTKRRYNKYCYPNTAAEDESLLLKVKIPNKKEYGWILNQGDIDNSYAYSRVVGWELNSRSKPGPRSVNLSPLLDSNHLAIQAADLNLKLMKWRMIPDLNVEKLVALKVLLIGAGTLGCSVARTLLGWGVRKFKFIDCGRVSYSNPVRQNLFTLDDCHADSGSGKPKALAAAEALKTIAADVESEGIVLSIPMPGHASENVESLQTTVETIDRLVEDSDVLFLLTDTRESRWLPTVMAAAHNKLLINAALGLDSWLVMRHGGGINQLGPRYGCYFCNDVVAPENSTKNRTLDQQCTVTRPGLAPIASSMAVELMVSLLHHPDNIGAAAPSSASNQFSPTFDSSSNIASPLGVIPHQIRGSLVSYTIMIPTVPAFEYCTACSERIVEAYQANNTEFVIRTCESLDGSYLENLSGLTTFRADAASKMEEFEDWEDE